VWLWYILAIEMIKVSATRDTASAGKRLVVALIVGIIVGVACVLFGAATFAVLGSWDAIILTYGVWTWVSIRRMNPAETKSHAVSENPGRVVADILLILASVASIVAVIIMLVLASNSSGVTKAVEIALGLTSIILSWAVVHITYMLKYARLYYGQKEGGMEFNEKDSPQYSDFAYLAFTLGMTFQVSDTELQTKEIRATALKHAMLSYLFGTVIIATTINTLASISS
jgi:uncharacterized membrane protein